MRSRPFLLLFLSTFVVQLLWTACQAFTTGTQLGHHQHVFRSPPPPLSLTTTKSTTKSVRIPYHQLTTSTTSRRVLTKNNINLSFQQTLLLSNRKSIARQLSPQAFPESISDVTMSLFRYDGNVPLLLAFGWNAVLFLALRSKLLKVLTPPGYFHAFALGTLLWNTLGWRGWTLCVLYLALGSLVTKVKFQEKQNMGIAEGRDGRRGPENVWGSAATGLLCAVCSVQGQTFLGIPSEMYVLGYVASLATKLSDTFASEIGKAYGKTTFLITTLERVEPGTEGAVSLEGTLASIVGGTLITLYGLAVGLIPTAAVPVSVVAAFVATNVESWLGATLQGRDDLKWITNEVVNFFNTLIGAILAIGAGLVLL